MHAANTPNSAGQPAGQPAGSAGGSAGRSAGRLAGRSASADRSADDRSAGGSTGGSAGGSANAVTASVAASTPTSGAVAAKEPGVRRAAVNSFEAGLLALVAAHEAKGLTTEEMSRALTRSANSDSMVAGALENLRAKSVEHKVCAAVANLVCKNRRIQIQTRSARWRWRR